ncbi:hypothetical protein A2U01_0039738 [Trifolium medium]|uniref:Uncharacterized protein n=1 Tax=Trifolium medium TaxID=97028 RepID=A0A392Q3A2_9FABA|nr:hypothetical protein [Trifolium medium]
MSASGDRVGDERDKNSQDCVEELMGYGKIVSSNLTFLEITISKLCRS